MLILPFQDWDELETFDSWGSSTHFVPVLVENNVEYSHCIERVREILAQHTVGTVMTYYDLGLHTVSTIRLYVLHCSHRARFRWIIHPFLRTTSNWAEQMYTYVPHTVLTLIVSCQSEQSLWSSCAEDDLILCGDETLETEYKVDKNILWLKCNDKYEGLPAKMLRAYWVIMHDPKWQHVHVVLKMDMTTFQEGVVTRPSRRDVYRSSLKYAYCGCKIVQAKRKHLGNWHIKLHQKHMKPTSKWQHTKYIEPMVPYAAGGHWYQLRQDALRYLGRFYPVVSTVIPQQHIFEDAMVGLLLSARPDFSLKPQCSWHKTPDCAVHHMPYNGLQCDYDFDQKSKSVPVHHMSIPDPRISFGSMRRIVVLRDPVDRLQEACPEPDLNRWVQQLRESGSTGSVLPVVPQCTWVHSASAVCLWESLTSDLQYLAQAWGLPARETETCVEPIARPCVEQLSTENKTWIRTVLYADDERLLQYYRSLDRSERIPVNNSMRTPLYLQYRHIPGNDTYPAMADLSVAYNIHWNMEPTTTCPPTHPDHYFVFVQHPYHRIRAYLQSCKLFPVTLQNQSRVRDRLLHTLRPQHDYIHAGMHQLHLQSGTVHQQFKTLLARYHFHRISIDPVEITPPPEPCPIIKDLVDTRFLEPYIHRLDPTSTVLIV